MIHYKHSIKCVLAFDYLAYHGVRISGSPPEIEHYFCITRIFIPLEFTYVLRKVTDPLQWPLMIKTVCCCWLRVNHSTRSVFFTIKFQCRVQCIAQMHEISYSDLFAFRKLINILLKNIHKCDFL